MTINSRRSRAQIVSVECLACGWSYDPNAKRATALRAAKRHAGECARRGTVVVDSEMTTSYQRVRQ